MFVSIYTKLIPYTKTKKEKSFLNGLIFSHNIFALEQGHKSFITLQLTAAQYYFATYYKTVNSLFYSHTHMTRYRKLRKSLCGGMEKPTLIHIWSLTNMFIIQHIHYIHIYI